MKKYLYLASTNKEMNYPIVYRTSEEALSMFGVVRVVKIIIDIPDVELTEEIAEEVSLNN